MNDKKNSHKDTQRNTKENFLFKKSLAYIFVYLCVTLWLKKLRRYICLKTI